MSVVRADRRRRPAAELKPLGRLTLPQLRLSLLVSALFLCLLGCEDRKVVVVYIQRDVQQGDTFDIHEVHGSEIPLAEFRQISNGMTDIEMVGYQGKPFIKPAKKGDMLTHSHFAEP